MFRFKIDVNMELKTKHGIDKLELMSHALPLFHEENVAQNYSSFKIWLSSQLKRDLTPQEELDLAECILKYVKSEPASNERIEATNYLINGNFIANTNS